MIDPSAFKNAVAGQYRIDRELGRGGMATVYLADDVKHARRVAIKVLDPELGAWLGGERFHAEIRITAALQHPHILPLLDSAEVRTPDSERGEGSSFLYYVMPFVEGETLRARIQRDGQMPVGDAVRIAKEVASALAYAHSHGVIHRDVKPENILLGAPDANGARPALLADFGVARSVDASGDRLTGTGITVGTVAYMSPEQATGERELDGRSDIYSLGCVLYEMLAGEPPHTGPNQRIVLAKKLTDPVAPVRRVRDAVPLHIDTALATALGRSPADRFPSAGTFADALDAPLAPPKRRVARIAAIGIAGVVVAATTWALVSRPTVAAGMPSVRVQRFTTAGGDTASAYLASTLQQDVTAALAASNGARVFAMDSARLPSGFAVNGTAARIAGSDSVEMRVTVYRDPSGEFVGRRDVKRPLGRVHELPEMATDAILELVGRRRAASTRRVPPTRDSIAYDLYLKGRYQTDRRTAIGTQRAVALFRAAVARDSTFAEGWAGLARAFQQVYLRRYSIPGIPADSILSAMYDASDRALVADSTRSYVWIARGLTLRDLDPSSRRNALLAYQKAIALDSNNADAWHYAAVAWDDSLEPARAVASWMRAVRIDPTHRLALGFLAQHYIWMRQYDSALAWADSGRRIDPTHILIRQQLGLANLYGRDTAAAAESFRASILIGKGPDEVSGWLGLSAIAMRGGNRSAADTLFARALALIDTLHPTLHDAAYVASGYAVFGDTTRAIRLLERYDPRVDLHFQLHLHCDAGLDPMRMMTRFKALISRPAKVCLALTSGGRPETGVYPHRTPENHSLRALS